MQAGDLEERLEEDWFRFQGVDPIPVRRIHPEDDMFRFEADLGRKAVSLRATYMRTGFEALRALDHALRTAHRPLASCGSMLEFASGYGRVTRFLVNELDPERITCSDVLPSAVEFVEANFGVGGIVSRTDPALLDLGRRHDVIWVASLFSHLPRHRFEEFMRTLFLALEPDGLLVFSTHGATIVPEVPKDPSGFTFVPMSESRILDTAEYGATFVTPELVHEIARSAGIEHCASLPLELWQQDLHVVSPRPVESLDDWQRSPLVRGSISVASVDDSGWGVVGGYARVPAEQELSEVQLSFDGETVVQATLEPLGETLPESAGGRLFHQINWAVGGPTDFLGPGVHTVCAKGRTAGGDETCFDCTVMEV